MTVQSDPPAESMTLTARVAEEVRVAMARKRISQRELGIRLGMSQPTISARTKGHVALNTDELERFARALGVTVNTLLGLPDPGDDGRPRQGSNLRPTAYKVADLADRVTTATQPVTPLRRAA